MGGLVVRRTRVLGNTRRVQRVISTIASGVGLVYKQSFKESCLVRILKSQLVINLNQFRYVLLC